MALDTGRNSSRSGASRGGSAFLVESMVLLVFLAVSLAIIFQLFGAALDRGNRGENLSDAVAAAGDVAEQFAANPERVPSSLEVGGMSVACEVTEEPYAHGTLYHATIKVLGKNGSARAAEASNPVYSISTSQYVSEVIR